MANWLSTTLSKTSLGRLVYFLQSSMSLELHSDDELQVNPGRDVGTYQLLFEAQDSQQGEVWSRDEWDASSSFGGVNERPRNTQSDIKSS